MGYLDCTWPQRELLDTQIVPIVGQMLTVLLLTVDYQMYGRSGEESERMCSSGCYDFCCIAATVSAIS